MLNRWRGRVYIQSWPRRRGKPKSALQQAWVDWFKYIAQYYKNISPEEQDFAREQAKGTGWYWRDLYYVAARGNLYMEPGERKITTPTASVYRSTAQALASGTETILTFDSQDWNNNSFVDQSQLNRLIARSPGLYLVSCQVVITNPTGSGSRAMYFRLNGGGIGAPLYGEVRLSVGNTQNISMECRKLWYFHANDYFQVWAHSTVANSTWRITQFAMVGITPESIIA